MKRNLLLAVSILLLVAIGAYLGTTFSGGDEESNRSQKSNSNLLLGDAEADEYLGATKYWSSLQSTRAKLEELRSTTESLLASFKTELKKIAPNIPDNVLAGETYDEVTDNAINWLQVRTQTSQSDLLTQKVKDRITQKITDVGIEINEQEAIYQHQINNHKKAVSNLLNLSHPSVEGAFTSAPITVSHFHRVTGLSPASLKNNAEERGANRAQTLLNKTKEIMAEKMKSITKPTYLSPGKRPTDKGRVQSWEKEVERYKSIYANLKKAYDRKVAAAQAAAESEALEALGPLPEETPVSDNNNVLKPTQLDKEGWNSFTSSLEEIMPPDWSANVRTIQEGTPDEHNVIVVSQIAPNSK